MWEAIKFTKKELGLNQFDFEGSMIQPIEQFFRKFGGNNPLPPLVRGIATLLYRFLDKAVGEIVAGCKKYNRERIEEI